MTESKKLKIILVQPSRRQGVRSFFTFHKNEGLGHKPPLAILTLATYLIRNGFENTVCIDAQLEDLTPEETADKIKEMKPDVVGLTVWTDLWYPSWLTIMLIREKLPECIIVVGGPHCTIYPGETLGSSAADFLVAGDGEDVLLSLIKGLSGGGAPVDMPGLWRKEDGKVVPPGEEYSIVEDHSRIPVPDRKLLPFKKYNNVLNSREYETTMITSRGCPYKCVFCKIHSQRVYARSAEQVVEEFKDIAELGITDIQVYDDTFTWSKERVMKICEGILASGLKVRWAVRDRSNKADLEMYKMMKRAGCYRIHFGVESGSPRILKESGKGLSLEQVEDAVRIARKAGFLIMAYYMFGFIDETYGDAMKTIEFSMKLDVDYAVYAVLIPYPGTKLYSTAMERGIIPNDFWLDYTKNPVPDFLVPHLVEQNMDRKTLIRLKDIALRKFYFRPSRIAREFLSLSSFEEFKRKSGMAMNIFTDSVKSFLSRNS